MAHRRDRIGRIAAWLDRRRWIPVVSLVLAGVLVTALERGRPDVIRHRQRPLRELVDAMLLPLRRAGTGLGELFDGSPGGGPDAEIARLRRDLARAEADLQITREELRRMARMSGLRNWRSPDEIEFLPADVIGVATDNGEALLVISRGRRDGLREGMPVVGPRGLAGVIVEVRPVTSIVQTPADPSAAIGVVDARSRRRGVVFGGGRGAPLRFLPEDEDAPLEPGALLLTSGLEGSVYPRGLIVGELLNPDTDDRGFLHGAVRAAQDVFALEEVLVVRPVDPGAEDSPVALGRYVVEMAGDQDASGSRTEPDGASDSHAAAGPEGDREPGAGSGNAPPRAARGFPSFSEVRRLRDPIPANEAGPVASPAAGFPEADSPDAGLPGAASPPVRRDRP